MAERNDEGDLLLKEVDEELRQDRLLQVWKKYGTWFATAAVLLVVGVAANQIWRGVQHDRSVAEAEKFIIAEQLAQAGKGAEAAQTFADLAGSSKTGYEILARFRQADLQLAGGDRDGARTAFETLAGDKDVSKLFRDLAIVKGVAVQADSGDPATLQGILAPLTVEGEPWRHSARELTAVLALRSGDVARAQTLYQQVADDLTAPSGLRARAAEILATFKPAEQPKG